MWEEGIHKRKTKSAIGVIGSCVERIQHYIELKLILQYIWFNT